MEEKLQVVNLLEILFLGIGTYYDVKKQMLPVTYLWTFTVVGILGTIFLRYQNIEDSVLGALMGVGILFVGWLTKEAIGYGDGWVLVILGLLEGLLSLSLIMMAAFIMSALFGAWKLICLKEKRDSTMPFLPFLFIALLGRVLL